MDLLLDIALKMGVPAALALYLVWRMDRRDADTILRLQSTEDWVREALMTALNECTSALRDSARTNRMIIRALEVRPCLREHPRPNDPHDYGPQDTGLRDVPRSKHDDSTDRMVRS